MAISASQNQFKVGGSLAVDNPTYVKRKADDQLLQALETGKFCYVFNCRQMGKSSLRVQAMRQLQAKGRRCASVDITSLGSYLSLQQWYAGIMTQLFLGLKLMGKVNLKTWLKERQELPPSQQLRYFLEEVVLKFCPENIVIFIDEIDKIISLDFCLDEFFSLIRFFFNQRAEDPQYQRLTFALFGVATPSDLIQDKTQTPFNIGQAIELTGLEINKSEALATGLGTVAAHPLSALKEILYWTGGQPFLTQKLCQLLTNSEGFIETGQEKEMIQQLVSEKVLENWESHDEPVHLKTIRDRLLRDEQRAGRLLGLYQKILDGDTIPVDDSPEQAELRLSGLVVKHNGQLQVYNPIYQQVFNQDWVKEQIGKLRPYSESILAWQSSEFSDESRLLRGQSLKDALVWAIGKSLSNLDYQYLTASQKLDKREAEYNLETERKANQILASANRRAQRTIAIGLGILILSLVGAGMTFQKQRETEQGNHLQRLGDSAIRQFPFDQLDALIAALKAAGSLQNLVSGDRILADYPATSPIIGLQQILDKIQEKNRLEGHQDAVTSVRFSPDDKKIITASRDGTLQLWDIQGKELATFPGHQGAVYGVSFSPDGKRLASASQDGTIKLWDLEGNELATFKGHEGSVYSLTFSPDGQYLASTSRDQTARLWDLAGNQKAVMRGHQKSVDQVVFSPDQTQLVTASRDGAIRFWDLQGRLLNTWQGDGVPLYSLSFSPDGKQIAAGARDGSVKIWDLSGQLLHQLEGHTSLVNRVQFSPDGTRILTASSDGRIKLWDHKGQALKTLSGHQEAVYDAVFSADGKLIASASSDGTAKLWNIAPKPDLSFSTHEKRVTHAAISPNGQLIAISEEGGMISLWNSQARLIKQFLASGNWISAIAFSANGQQLATASRSGNITLWDNQGNRIKTFEENGSPSYSLAFSPNGKSLASGTRDGGVFIWDLTQPEAPPQSLPLSQAAIDSLQFSPDGFRLIAGTRNGTVNIWHQRELEQEIVASETGILAIAFDPNGQSFATTSRNGQVIIWDLQGNQQKRFFGDQFPVRSVVFRPDGKRIATASNDGMIRLWDLSGKLRAELQANPDAIYALSFTAKGEEIVAVSREGTVRLWQVREGRDSLDNLITRGCDWLKDYLSVRSQEQQKLAESDTCLSLEE